MRIRLLHFIGNVLKTDYKTKPTTKLNCRFNIGDKPIFTNYVKSKRLWRGGRGSAKSAAGERLRRQR